MKAFARLLSVLAIPLGMLNMLGGIISGIWLAILGEWGLIGYGLLVLVFSGMALGLVMAPGLIFAVPAAAMLEKGNKVGGYFFGLLSTIYIVGILTTWCILVLLYYTKHADADSIIPVLIWSYGIATGPITWLAQKDLQSGNEYAMVTTFFIEVAYILTMLAIIFVGVSLINVIVLFGVVMTIGLIVQFSAAYLAEKSQAYF
jgi:hypothetical protein